jgi:hypothetical protein
LLANEILYLQHGQKKICPSYEDLNVVEEMVFVHAVFLHFNIRFFLKKQLLFVLLCGNIKNPLFKRQLIVKLFFRRLAMNQTLIKKASKAVFVVCILLLVQTSLVLAAENITGEWEMTMNFGGRESFATMTITKNDDGTLAGKWGSDNLSDVKFDGEKLTFVRTIRFGDQEFTMDYEGTLKDGKITGTMSSDRGEFSANGARRKPKLPILGQWDIKFNVQDREINARLIVTQKPDGTLEGKWNEEGEHVISNINFQDGKLSFTRKSKVNDMEFETTYEGTVKGNELTGVLKGEMGDFQADGKRFGTALIGKWELTSTSDFGTFTNMMKIEPDLTGRYEFFGGEIPMKDLKLDGDQVTFYIEFGPPDQTFKMEFKGKLDGKTIKGQMESDRGISEITGKKLEPEVKAEAASVSASALVGKWELTTVSERGERTRMLTINADMTGTYQVRDGEVPIKDLKLEGDQVTFKVEMSFGDRQFEMDFKGALKDGALEGEFTTERGTMKATGKKVN